MFGIVFTTYVFQFNKSKILFTFGDRWRFYLPSDKEVNVLTEHRSHQYGYFASIACFFLMVTAKSERGAIHTPDHSVAVGVF